MADLGFGAGGVSEGLQLVQSLQTGKIEQQQKQVALEASTLQLDNLKKLQASLGGQAFQSAMGSGDPGQQNKALTDLATTYLADGMPEQAKAVTDMATSMATTRAYVTEQNAMAASKIWGMAGDLLGGATDAATWNAGIQLLQKELTPEQMGQPGVKQLLSTPYSANLVQSMPGFSKHMQERAQALADVARGHAADAEARHYGMESELITHQEKETDARTAKLNKDGATGLIPSKEETAAAAADLQAKYPEAEAEPFVVGGQNPDPTAMRANYKARLDSVARRVSEAAKFYEAQGMSPADARKKAIDEAEVTGATSILKAPPGPQGRGKPTAAPAAGSPAAQSSADAWGTPTQVSP